MLIKVKNIISKADRFLFKKFGSDKTIKSLENLKEARIIFSYLNEIGKETVVRFVGGCVRKALSGETVDDIDLATSLEPEVVKSKLAKNNVKVIDTGILHGTVTAILSNKKFEITTLRKDILPDGRHSKVEFTLDWERDSQRRDFTINAIYADIEGRIFDPLSGRLDLQNGKIKFIGSPLDRIQEDYLRILRYFRFFTQYSKLEHDREVIRSIKQNVNGLNKISKERIFDELQKILSLKNISNLFINDDSKEIILNIFPQFKHYQRLKNINKLNKNIIKLYDTDLILASLILDDSNNYEFFCYKYKTSNAIKNRFKNICDNLENLKNKEFYSEKNIKRLIYFTHKDSVKDLLLFSLLENRRVKTESIEKLLIYIDNYKVPKFSISGDYLMERGYKSGQDLGKKLKFLEKKWIENDFNLDKKMIEKSLGKIANGD